MARAPFQTEPNQPDIPAVQLRGGFTPVDNDAVVKQAGQAAQVVGGVVAEQFQKGIEDDIKTQAQSLELALTARAFPKFAKQLLAEHAKDDPVVKGAMREMSDIKLALDQGVLPHQFAMQRLSAIKQNAIGAAPEFADEINAAVADISGRDPDKALFAELLQPAKPTLTPEQKGLQAAEEEIAKQMALTGLDRDTIISINQTRQLANQEEANLKFLTTRGERLTLTLNKRAVLATGTLTEDIVLELQQVATSQGGVIDTAAFARDVNSRFDAKIQELISDLPEGADLTAADPALELLEKQRSRVLGMVQDGSLLNLVNNQKDLLIKGTQLGMIQSSPDILTSFAFNPSDATRGIELIDRMGKTLEQKNIAGALSPAARLLNETEDGRLKFFNFYSGMITEGKVSSPVPTSNDDKLLHGLATVTAMKSDNPAVQAKALEQMLDVHGEDFAWASLGSREIFLAVDEKSMGKAIENLQISQTAALGNEFKQIMQLPAFDPSRLRISGTKVDYVTDPTLILGTDPNRDNEIRNWLGKFNRAAKISDMYVKGGKMNGALYQGLPQFWEKVTGQAFDAMQEAEGNRNLPKQTTVKWERDESGRPRPIVE